MQPAFSVVTRLRLEPRACFSSWAFSFPVAPDFFLLFHRHNFGRQASLDDQVTMNDASGSTKSKFEHRRVLKSQYNDPLRLQSSLNDICGEGNYSVKVISGRYIISSLRPMKEEEMESIEKRARLHYNS
ncbi:hypothetical protein Cob_v011724 [Colletotrichum orbiculare MAFF 240422]|uniref:Uncharacterized protein n=1 Tax=Colletotrichum orbiculare (strain 104-T / ATCC 96160 / CBS 514.97 / LARS 414 / MAFF 240422) TaxID=1213857 RepID=A0A484FEG7_COLOR|nr:hypothetical protein Cob_v011724 [Colletotrichum orbiculare MAFF 240422]